MKCTLRWTKIRNLNWKTKTTTSMTKKVVILLLKKSLRLRLKRVEKESLQR